MRSSNPIKSFKSYFILLAIAMVLSLSSVTALTEDFSAFTGSETINTCACDLTTDSLTVRNDGDVTSTFVLDVSGDASKWVNMAPQVFYLEPGQSKRVDRFINLPCSARDRYSLNTTITTTFGLEKSLYQTLDVVNCQNVQVVPQFSGAQQECPCTPVEYSFEVINTGQHLETYDLSVEPFSDAISMSTDFLILDPGESQMVSVFINLECGQYGERVFTFNAFAKGTKMLGQTDFQLNIDKCYDYDLTVGEEYGVCGGVPNIIPFDIKNSADIANEYIMDVSGVEWAYPETDTLAAWGGEIVGSNIIITPPNDEEFVEIINLNAVSVRGQEGRSAEILLETEQCHDYTLVPAVDAFKAIDCADKDHVFYLTNIGTRTTTYYVGIEGIDSISASDDPIVLGPGEATEVVFSGEAPCEMYGDFLENVYVTMEEVNQTYLEEKVFSIHSKDEAYLPYIGLDDLSIGYEGGESEIILSNAGFETAEYSLQLIGSDWLSLDRQEVVLAPGENATILLIATPSEDIAEDVYLAELVVSVPGEGVEYSAEFLVELSGSGSSSWIITVAAGSVLLLAIVLLVVWLVSKKKEKKIVPGSIIAAKKEYDAPVENYMSITKRKYVRDEQEEIKKIRMWPLIFIALLALLIASGAYFTFTSGVFSGVSDDSGAFVDSVDDAIPADVQDSGLTDGEVLTNADISDALVTLDLTQFSGKGNMIEIEDDEVIVIPMTVHNPTDMKTKLSLSSEDIWVSFDKDLVSIAAGSDSSAELRISPDLTALDEARLISFNVDLEGKKINYTEDIELVLAKKSERKDIPRFWFWLIGGILGLVILFVLLKSLRKDKNPETEEQSKHSIKEKIVYKEKVKKIKSKIKKDSSWAKILGMIMIIAGILVVISLLGIIVYNNINSDPDNADTESADLDISSDLKEDIDVSDIPSESAEQTNITIQKMTEDDVEQPLITIDRQSIPGKGNVFKLKQEQYIIPISIQNPTDRKARFAVSIEDGSWIAFDRYVILVLPESTNTVNMTITPDLSALENKDYSVTVNTKLEGNKIDYSEDLEFVLTKDKSLFERFWLYLLLLIIIAGIVFASTQMSRKIGSPKKKKKSGKTKQKDKDVDAINKEISALREKTMVSLKKGFN
ncbi:MAG: hypothetical protein ABIA62_01325 [Candidatus Woesearchaeota archaeon]